MNPIVVATIRRHWPLVGAIGVFAVFTVADQLLFDPAARRYQAAVKRATELGLALDPAQTPAMMPPRVFAVVADNALPSAEATEMANSGVLTARLVETLSRVAGASGVEMVSTQPGAVSQQSRSVTVRGQFRLRGRYDRLVAFLDELSRTGTLIAVDRFTIAPESGGRMQMDLWVSRLVLKQTRRGR